MSESSEHSLGVTKLLNELLEDDPGASLCLPTRAAPAGYCSSQAGGVSRSEQAGGSHAATTASLPAVADEHATSAMLGQMTELHAEMDSYLASLMDWQSERARERESLKKELELQMGLSSEDTSDGRADENEPAMAGDLVVQDLGSSAPELPGLAALASDATCGHHGEADGCRGGTGQKAAIAATPKGSLKGDTNSSSLSFLLKSDDEPTRRADEERIARLRAEVEELRQREKEMAGMRQRTELESFDASLTGIGLSPLGTNNLSAWCAEVDEILLDPTCNGTSDLDRASAPRSAGIDSIEEQLIDAREQLGHMEGALGDAHSRIQAELNDLDKLLAECDAIQTQTC